MAFRSIKAANKKINEQLGEIDLLKLQVRELKQTISDNESNVSAQQFADMRLRAQKAELALEAMTQANINNSISSNMRKQKSLEEIKTLIQNL